MIDIIIPYYNDREGLFKCLSSIAAQTVKRTFQVTVVDDCSDESVQDIIDFFSEWIFIDYIRLDTRHKYPGLVRQEGINATHNEYIMFVDSDDILSNEAIDSACIAISQSQSPFIQGFFMQQIAGPNGKQLVQKTNEITWLHGNIYKRSFLEKHNIKFMSGYNEDMAFNILCRLYAMPNDICQKNMYYWLYNDKSLTREEDGGYAREGNKDYVFNLMTSYIQLIQTIVKPDKRALLSSQIGCSIAVFYEHFVNTETKYKDKGNADKIPGFRETYFGTYRLFAKDINEFLANYISEFKLGFCQTYLTRNWNGEPSYTINEFLDQMGIDIKIEPEDFKKINQPAGSNVNA